MSNSNRYNIPLFVQEFKIYIAICKASLQVVCGNIFSEHCRIDR